MYYFQPTSSERRGLLVLSIALALALGAVLWGIRTHGSGDKDANLQTTPSVAHRRQPYYAVAERQVETFDFDPNTADSTALLRLGFPPYMVRNIYRYRAHGGRYHEVDDLRRTYGMTNELWDRLVGHIRIAHRFQYVEPLPRRRHAGRASADAYVEEPVPSRDTVRYPVKLREGQSVAVNKADTNMLKKIPGIGSYYARQIVRYRELLGGFVSLEQLQEIEGIPEDVGDWLHMDSVPVRRIDVNHATKNQLLRHPYLGTYRARAIWDRRHNYGPLRSMDDLRTLPDFTDADVRRLTPYLEFKN